MNLTFCGQYYSLLLVLFWQREYNFSIFCFLLHSLFDFSWPFGDVHVYSHLFGCLWWRSCWLHRNLQADLLLHSDPQSKFSNNTWFCFISYFCVPITYNYQHTFCVCVINFFLYICVKDFNVTFLVGAQTLTMVVLTRFPRTLIDIIQLKLAS